MKRIITSLPVWIVLADMVYGFALNIIRRFHTDYAPPPQDGLPVSPDIAFSGLQVLAGGGMMLIIGFGLWVLLQLNRTVLQQQILPIGVFRSLGLLAVLAFSLPAVWEWGWALARFAGGSNTLAFGNLRYFIVALCQPLVALLCVWRLLGWYRLHQTAAVSDGEDVVQ
ncbi:hypothetical protein LVJ83_01265 [Uruburuella testudinis]|uniref:Integral membrane protein n=1 Tax=Uruburuella testudinis TaxID=1282863 RepID=A0ABY4DWZ8_9NEIS|nr:hypothetical protein [Uruburuella testudinis]UOO82137.1 hypothetical protein LVJ83_01265 [Uruburuella testudinis]